jgi:DNA processing protein
MNGAHAHNPTAAPPTKAWVNASFVPPIPRLIRAEDPEFPTVLAGMPRPARQLWVRGRIPDSNQASLAIVGARAASREGCARAAELADVAVRARCAIVSGGALGIDAAAHRAAMAARGATYAVLGCGIDVVYPDRHAGLFDDIARSGGLLTEHDPGEPPRAGHFPVRNRIVVALSRAVLVVEAGFGSGALVTARLALSLRRPLYAVPGSPGTDALIADGRARRVSNGDDLAGALAGEAPAARVTPMLLRPLIAALRAGDAGSADVARRLGISLAAALALTAEGELGGWVVRRPGGRFGISPEVAHGSD